eukprot:SAG22_NODE_2200_length_2844_cov_2.300911_1_plen_863_part_00
MSERSRPPATSTPELERRARDSRGRLATTRKPRSMAVPCPLLGGGATSSVRSSLLLAVAAAATVTLSVGIDDGHARAAALRSCEAVGARDGGGDGGSFQRWVVRLNPANASQVSLHLASDPTACLKTASSVVWVEACTNNVSNYWVLRPSTAGEGAFLLVHASTEQCAAAGCNAQLSLQACEGRGKCLDNATRSPSGNSTGHPQDCLLRHDNSTGQLRTVSSQLCVDGGSAMPSKGCVDEASKALPFCNATLSNHERAADLVGRLSVPEMASGLLSMLNVPQKRFDGTNVMHNTRFTAGVARLGVPPIFYNEALHGPIALCLPPSQGGRCPTMWPIHISQSAAFNRTMWKTIATQIGREGRALYNGKLDAANYWGPDVNPFRDPRYGRGQETPGEDAWVNAELATQYVLGLQDGPANGTHRAQRLRATAACKHILVYDGQSGVDVDVSTRDLHDYYMQPWHSCAAVGHSASMMCSYGALNVSSPASAKPSAMVPDCADGDLINGVLRNRWNWSGFVVSDCDAVQGIEGHIPGIEHQAAAALAIKNGVDLNCGPQYQNFLAPAFESGLVSREVVATAAMRVLEHQIALGTFDDTTPYDGLSLDLVGSDEHAASAYDAAAQAIILLQNDQKHLPLSSDSGHGQGRGLTVAVIGPHANSSTGHDSPGLLGAYNDEDNTAVLNQTMLLAARRHFGAQHVVYSPGCDSLGCPNRSAFAAATAAAKQADVAVVFLGISGEFEAETRDRNACSERPWEHSWTPPEFCPGPNPNWKHGESVGLALPGNQTALALAVIKANPRTIVVLIHGGMVLLDEIVATGASIVSALYPGQQGGDALWDVLSGRRPPAVRRVATRTQEILSFQICHLT